MRKLFQFVAVPFVFLIAVGTVGCTLYGGKTPPTLATTTSAEQYERTLWQMAQKQQWGRISPLFAATLVWSADGKTLSGDQVVPYLQSLHLQDAVVRDAAVQPNGPDMTVTYTLQLSGANGQLREFSVFSVWQQLKGGAYVLIAHSQQGVPAAAGGPAGC